MSPHLNKRIVFKSESDFKQLYSWSISEEGGDGDGFERQIPWEWAQDFVVSNLTFIDIYEKDASDTYDLTDGPTPQRFMTRPAIRARLAPRVHNGRQTKYLMFGTSREISDLELSIEPAETESASEAISSWGCVRYTYETDFRTKTQDDAIVFSLVVSPSQFWRYAEMIKLKSVDSAEFRVGLVEGFYSHWSPSISADTIKVLTKSEEHKVEGVPAGAYPPRLGAVGSFHLMIKCFAGSEPQILGGAPIQKLDSQSGGTPQPSISQADPLTSIPKSIYLMAAAIIILLAMIALK